MQRSLDQNFPGGIFNISGSRSCLSVFLVRNLSRKDRSDSASRVGGAFVIGGLYNVYFWFDLNTSPEYCKTFCEMDC